MARLAATELGADWVINSDADEFWWPRGGTLRDVLAAIPRRFGSVRGCWRHFVPRPGDGRPFAERMVVRLTRPHHPGEKTSIYHAHQKVAHRADPSVSVETGNHEVIGRGLQPLRGWLPIEVLHFSLRSVEQIERKGRSGWYVGRDPDLAEHQIRLGHAVRAGRGRGFLDAVTVDDAALERGLADGTLAIDTRLRDALRGIRGPDGSFSLPVLGAPPVLSFDRPSASDDALLAAEVAPLADIDGVVRAGERVAALDLRLARLEREPLARLRRLARP
jgi:hypothetical protein